MTSMQFDRQPLLSRPVSVAATPPEGVDIEIVANDAERAALAEHNGLVAIHALKARLRLKRWRGEGLEVDGELRARVRQTCVVTLEPFDADIIEPLHVRYAPPPEADRRRARERRDIEQDIEQDIDISGDDPPDPMIGGVVDLGASVSEFLTLALDPYPRKPGAEFQEPAPADDNETSPFATLRSLTPRGDRN
jgi:hypothetical protein